MEIALRRISVAFVDDPLHGESGDPGGVVVGERDVVVVDCQKVSDNDTSENGVGVSGAQEGLHNRVVVRTSRAEQIKVAIKLNVAFIASFNVARVLGTD